MNLEGNEIIIRSAALRGQYKFAEAIKLIEENIDSINLDLHINAWLEAFKAAQEIGDEKLIKHYAKKVEREDPNTPSIQSYL